MGALGGHTEAGSTFRRNDRISLKHNRRDKDRRLGFSTPASTDADPENLEETERRARLARTIEGEIIPRLKLAHGAVDPAEAENGMPVVLDGHRVPTAADIEVFTKLIIAQDASVAVAHLELLQAHGLSLECLFLDLLAPCAQLLGDLWLADECSFIDVTIGLARLQQVLRELSPEFEADSPEEAHPRRRILLMPAPGEQHAFGLSLVEHFLRRAGWEVTVSSTDNAGVSKLLRREWFTLVGFSMSSVGLLEGLQSCIRSLRQVSRNPGISFLVGGNAFNDHPDLVSRVGADAMAGDGCLAVQEANRLSMPPCVSAATAPARRSRKQDGAAGLKRQGRSV